MKLRIFKIPSYFFCSVLTILYLFAILPQVTVCAEERMFIPVGKTVGIAAELGGVSVVNTTQFENSSGGMSSPAADAGILPGDTILKIDEQEINSAAELERITSDSEGREMNFLIERDGKPQTIRLSAAINADDGKFRLGVWIKDSASGIGTMTYYDPQTLEFGALGHGICDDENRLIAIRGGSMMEAEVASVNRGERGTPGELIGIFSDNSNKMGTISTNSDVGVYGQISDSSKLPESPIGAIPPANRDEVSEGSVTILSNVEGKEICEYSAKIVKKNKDEESAKGMVIEITDERLLEKTGGIVRGMSGSPIIQNGKLVGAITHVFVSDPTRGYGIFIENMLDRN